MQLKNCVFALYSFTAIENLARILPFSVCTSYGSFTILPDIIVLLYASDILFLLNIIFFHILQLDENRSQNLPKVLQLLLLLCLCFYCIIHFLQGDMLFVLLVYNLCLYQFIHTIKLNKKNLNQI